MEFYISLAPQFHGPWPTNCKEVSVQHNIKGLNEAKQVAKKYIEKDPESSIIEIVEAWIMFSWTYTVKLFKIVDNQQADIHVGKGRRYVAFDSNKFKYRDHILDRLRNEGYY